MPACLSFYLPVYLFVCLSIYLNRLPQRDVIAAWARCPSYLDLGVCLTFLSCCIVAWPRGCLVVCMQLNSAVLWCLDLMLILTCGVCGGVCCRWHVAILAVLFAWSLMSIFCLDLKLISTCVVLARSTVDSSSPFLILDLSYCLCTYLCIHVSMYPCTYVSIYLCIYLSIFLSMYLCINPSIYLSIYLIYLSN